jgi:hypothetical protein
MALVLKWVFVLVSAILAGYVGMSVYGELRFIRVLHSPAEGDPVVWEGHTFANETTMEMFRLEKARDKFHPWTGPLEEWLALLILASCTGFIGSLFRFLVDSCDRRKKPRLLLCLMGLGIGICLVAIAWVTGTAQILEGKNQFSYETLAAVSFLAGIFVQSARKFVSMQVQKIFGHDN